jgi:hypothetical protein
VWLMTLNSSSGLCAHAIRQIVSVDPCDSSDGMLFSAVEYGLLCKEISIWLARAVIEYYIIIGVDPS